MSSESAIQEPQWVEPFTPSDGVRRATEGFERSFGMPPEGISAAPGRVNIIGEHTDYNGGFCLPIALPHQTYVAARARHDNIARFASAQLSEEVTRVDLEAIGPGTESGWTAYTAGVLWALNTLGHPSQSGPAGLDVAVDSAVPFGAGLSSSAALEASVAMAADDLHGFGLAENDAGRTIMAAACMKAENEVAGAPTGGMDQSISLRAREGHALLLDCLDSSVRQVPFDLEANKLSLVVIDTRAPHALVDGQYAERRSSCERAAQHLGIAKLREIEVADLDDALSRLEGVGTEAEVAQLQRRVRHVVTEISRVVDTVALLDEGKIREIGPLLNASHESLRYDYEVTCPELDLAVETARANGALGARMTGGGFGGSAIALVEAGTEAALAEAIVQAYAAAGFADPAFLLATAAQAAHVIQTVKS